jgi:Tfp pilus assembly protein FimV
MTKRLALLGAVLLAASPLLAADHNDPNSVNSRLLELAKENVSRRPNAEAKLLLAKAYRKARRREDARRVLDEVLATPYRTPELTAFLREAGRS